MIMQGCVIPCGTVVFFQKSRNLSPSLLTNNHFLLCHGGVSRAAKDKDFWLAGIFLLNKKSCLELFAGPKNRSYLHQEAAEKWANEYKLCKTMKIIFRF